jgi:PAS domain S-box-containing protein
MANARLTGRLSSVRLSPSPSGIDDGVEQLNTTRMVKWLPAFGAASVREEETAPSLDRIEWNVVAGGGFVLVYAVVAHASLHVALMSGSAWPVWPAGAVGLAGLILLGTRFWPVLFVGATAAGVATPLPFATAAIIGACVTLQGVVAAMWLRKLDVNPSLDSPRDLAAVWAVGGILTPLVGASASAGALTLVGTVPPGSGLDIFAAWYLGDAARNVLLVPLILSLGARPLPRWNVRRAWEFVAVIAATLGTALLARHAGAGYAGLPFVPLIWAIVRFDLRGTAVVSTLVALIGVWVSTHAPSGLATVERREVVRTVYEFVLIFGVTGLTMSILAERRRRITGALAASEAKFRTTFFASPTPTVIVSLTTRSVQDVNDAWSRTFGWTREAVVGRSGDACGLWTDTADGQRFVDRVRQRSIHDCSMSMSTCGGDQREVLISAVPVEIDGTPCAFMAIQDLTDHHRLERELVQAQKMEAVARLSGGVAHDFNNLLMVILGTCQLALPDLREDSDIHRDLSVIQATAEQAADLTRQLLSFSRHQVMHIETVELNAVVSECGTLLERIIGDDVALVVAPSASPIWIRADAGQLSQVIMNLAVNARDAMADGGVLRIATGVAAAHGVAATGGHDPGPRVTLTVSDTGCGMSRETQARMFEPFFTTKPPGRGTGLGLSTVYGIVTQLGGDVRVDSVPGCGTTFTMSFPAAQPTVRHVEAPRPDTGRRGHGTILVVEDQIPVRGVIDRILTRAGYRVVPASSPQEALTASWPEPPDLLLSDLVMPGMNGIEVATAARRRWPGLRVLFMSGYQAETAPEGAVPGFAHGVLAKPFTADSLTDRVREVLAVAVDQHAAPPPRPPARSRPATVRSA